MEIGSQLQNQERHTPPFSPSPTPPPGPRGELYGKNIPGAFSISASKNPLTRGAFEAPPLLFLQSPRPESFLPREMGVLGESRLLLRMGVGVGFDWGDGKREKGKKYWDFFSKIVISIKPPFFRPMRKMLFERKSGGGLFFCLINKGGRNRKWR